MVELENDGQITKKLRENRKFRTKKYFFSFFENLFLDHWNELYNIQSKVFSHKSVFWKPYFRHWHPYPWVTNRPQEMLSSGADTEQE